MHFRDQNVAIILHRGYGTRTSIICIMVTKTLYQKSGPIFSRPVKINRQIGGVILSGGFFSTIYFNYCFSAATYVQPNNNCCRITPSRRYTYTHDNHDKSLRAYATEPNMVIINGTSDSLTTKITENCRGEHSAARRAKGYGGKRPRGQMADLTSCAGAPPLPNRVPGPRLNYMVNFFQFLPQKNNK